MTGLDPWVPEFDSGNLGNLGTSRLRPATFLHGLLQEIHNDFDWNQFALLEASLLGPQLPATTGLLEEYPYFLVLACMSPVYN